MADSGSGVMSEAPYKTGASNISNTEASPSKRILMPKGKAKFSAP
jgi:hypothetical protein